MGKQNPSTGREKAVAAALRRFPQYELTIHRLMLRAEGFRDMCEELAEAELALERVDQVPSANREERKAEWQALVDRLVAEVEAELRGCDPFRSHSNPEQ